MTQACPQGPWFLKAKTILPLFFNFWPMVRENSAMTSYHPDDNLFNFHLLCEPIELEYVTIRKTKKRLPIFKPIENMKRNHLDIYGNSWKKKKRLKTLQKINQIFQPPPANQNKLVTPGTMFFPSDHSSLPRRSCCSSSPRRKFVLSECWYRRKEKSWLGLLQKRSSHSLFPPKNHQMEKGYLQIPSPLKLHYTRNTLNQHETFPEYATPQGHFTTKGL